LAQVGDRLRRDLLLEAVERDAVHRLGRRAAPDGLVGSEGDVGDARGLGVVEHSLGDDVQERVHVLRLLGFTTLTP